MNYEKLMIVLVCLFSYILFSLLRSIKNFFNTKSEESKAKKELLENQAKSQHVNTYMGLLTAGTSLLTAIDTMIQSNIANYANSLYQIKRPYNFLSLDTDVERISRDIFARLNAEVFDSTSTFFKAEYVMEFIAEQVTTRLVAQMKEVNSNLNMLLLEKKDEV